MSTTDLEGQLSIIVDLEGAQPVISLSSAYHQPVISGDLTEGEQRCHGHKLEEGCALFF